MANTTATAQTKTSTKTTARKSKATQPMETLETLAPISEVLTAIEPIEAVEIPVEKINFEDKDSNGRRLWNLSSLRAKVMTDMPLIAKGEKVIEIKMVLKNMSVTNADGTKKASNNSDQFRDNIRKMSAEYFNNKVTVWAEWEGQYDEETLKYTHTESTIAIKQRVNQAEAV